MIADMAEEMLVAAGYEVCGIARTVDKAVALAKHHKPDLAVLDLRLAHGGLGTEIAAQLGDLTKLGVLYASGNIVHIVLTAADGHGCIAKPYSAADLVRSLEIVAEIAATGTSTLPYPRGFQMLQAAVITPLGGAYG
jgi:DNA-binding response OmpR family regulator